MTVLHEVKAIIVCEKHHNSMHTWFRQTTACPVFNANRDCLVQNRHERQISDKLLVKTNFEHATPRTLCQVGQGMGRGTRVHASRRHEAPPPVIDVRRSRSTPWSGVPGVPRDVRRMCRAKARANKACQGTGM